MPSVSHGWYFLRFALLESAYVFPGSPAVSGSGHAAFDILSTHSVFAGGILTFLTPGKSYRGLKLWILNPLTCIDFLVLSNNCQGISFLLTYNHCTTKFKNNKAK